GGGQVAAEHANQVVVAPAPRDRADLWLVNDRLEDRPGVVVEASDHRQVDAVPVSADPARAEGRGDRLELRDPLDRSRSILEPPAQAGEGLLVRAGRLDELEQPVGGRLRQAALDKLGADASGADLVELVERAE